MPIRYRYNFSRCQPSYQLYSGISSQCLPKIFLVNKNLKLADADDRLPIQFQPIPTFSSVTRWHRQSMKTEDIWWTKICNKLADANTILSDANLSIGYTMVSVVDAYLGYQGDKKFNLPMPTICYQYNFSRCQPSHWLPGGISS